MNQTKELIITTTIDMIKGTNNDPTLITIRDISREAGIAVSQINYHFQSKENLIASCVQRMITDIIALYDHNLSALKDMDDFDKLKYMANLTYSFLYENENLARISILTDHKSASRKDNTNQTVNAYLPLVEKICKTRNLENARLKTMLLVLALQGIFLRTDIINDELNIDLRNPKDRKDFIDKTLEQYFK